MAQVMFKRGHAADLKALDSSLLRDGTFYITDDTDKLYIGYQPSPTKEVELRLLNQVVHNVANIAALPAIADAAVGEFYYCVGENVLATKKAAADTSWTQINADTDTKVSDVTTATAVASGVATVTTTVKSTNKAGASAGEKAGSFKIKGAGDNTITRETDGTIVITGKNDNATYTLGTAEGGKIALKGAGTGATDTEITVKGAGDIAITSDAEGNLTVDGTTLKNAIADATQNVTITSVKNEFTADGKFTTEVATAAGSKTAPAIAPIIKLGTNAAEYKFESGTATLPVYTKTEVDNKFKTADAMVYMGTISKADDLLAEVTVKRGWTYKVATAGSYAGVACKVGDLIIAKVDGTPTNDSTTWDVVPSGDDQTIVGDVSNTGITISDSAADGGVLAGFTIVNGDCTTASGTLAANGKTTEIKVNHAPVTEGTLATGSTADVTQTAKGTAEFSAITGITRDAYGHITGTTVKKLTVVDTDTHHHVTAVATTATHTSSGAVVTTMLTQDGVTPNIQTTLNVVSDNLTVTNGGTDGTTAKDTLKINLEWGTF